MFTKTPVVTVYSAGFEGNDEDVANKHKITTTSSDNVDININSSSSLDVVSKLLDLLKEERDKRVALQNQIDEIKRIVNTD